MHDGLGSVRQVLNTNGDVVNYYTYEPFGELFATEAEENVWNPFLFTGQYYDPEIAQYYLRARQYDPHIARFTARDPISCQFDKPLTLHNYLYCRNNPSNAVDPSGLWGLGLRHYLQQHVEGVEDAYTLSDREVEIAARKAKIWENPSLETWHGHSDFGYHQGGFDYTRLDREFWTKPHGPGFPLHFRKLEDVEFNLSIVLRSGDVGGFELLMHMGQDYFSHRGKGYGPIGHIRAWDKPDYPYTTDPQDPARTFASAYRQAQRWTKYFEDLWYLVWDNYEWTSLP